MNEFLFNNNKKEKRLAKQGNLGGHLLEDATYDRYDLFSSFFMIMITKARKKFENIFCM